MSKRLVLLTLLWAPALAGQSVRPDPTSGKPFASMQLVPIRNGPNRIDLDGDGHMDEVFNARRENGNAHDFSVLSFFASYPAYTDTVDTWHVVPFFDRRGVSERDALKTEEGADCILQDIWIVRDSSRSGAGVEVVVGTRPFGSTYISPGIIEFQPYRIVRDTTGGFGHPALYFEPLAPIKSTRRYCDVDRAAIEVLGLKLPESEN